MDTPYGPTTLPWAEINGFSSLYGGLAFWEAKLLREMSLEYMAGLGLGKDPLGKPPWDEAVLVVAHRMRKK